METKVVDIQAETLSCARQKLQSACVDGWHAIAEKVLERGSNGTVRGLGDSIEEARENAIGKLPSHADIVKSDLLPPGEDRVIDLLADTARNAQREGESRLAEREQILQVQEIASPRTGFLGIGKKKGRYSARARTMAAADLSYVLKPQIRATLVKYNSLADSLGGLADAPIPDNWTCFRSEDWLFHLWYPCDWALDTGEHLVLKPVFSERIRESDSNVVYSPAISLFVLSPPTGKDGESFLSTFGENLPRNFKGFGSVSDERLSYRGNSAVCKRFFFTRTSGTWEAFMLLLPFSDKFFVLDASGRAVDVMKYSEELEKVLATFQAFATPAEFRASAPTQAAHPNLDTCPESNVVGILFSIEDIKGACYGKVLQEEFFKTLDVTGIAGTRISIGDVLPDAEFFCVKLETPGSSVAQYVREGFGESCRAKGVAPFDRRFMSGNALDRQPLLHVGQVSAEGQYSGRNWY